MKNESMIDAGLLLPKMLAEGGATHGMTEVAAKIAWSRVAGRGLRPHAVPFRLHGKTLVVSVADAIWQKQLRTMSSELVFRINKLLHRDLIESIEFRIDPGALKNTASAIEKQRKAKSQVPVPGALVSAASEIADPELRQRFIRAAANCISRREARAQTKN